MKCYCDHTHGHFLDYFNDPILDDAVNYADDTPFQYNKVEGKYTEFIINPAGTLFIAVKRDHEFLISQNKNNANMSSNSINFGTHNTNQNCSNFVQSYHTQKWDADMEYLGGVRMAIYSHVVIINLTYPANSQQVYGILMNEVRDEAIYISNKYKIQIEPLQFDWDKFLPSLGKDFPDIINEVLSCKNNQKP